MDYSEIKAFAFDIDGVATNGSLLCNSEGDFLRIYDAKDGFAIRMATMNGYPVAVITGGSSDSIRKRMMASGVAEEDIFLHCRDKRIEFNLFCLRHNLHWNQVLYIGDDIPDICVMEASGCGACPSDAVQEVKAAADWVSPYPGGGGCIRHTLETVMKKQGKWVFDPQVYKEKF